MITDKIMEWVAVLFAVGMLALFLLIIVRIWNGTINISTILEEPQSANNPGGKASLSRLQLLLFTLVVGGLYVVLSIKAENLIDIPETVLGLIAISASAFLISKGIGK